MGNLAKNWKVKPQKIFSSSAKRALTTAQIFADYLGFAESDIAILENLYLCSVNEILNTIKSADDSLNSIALFSHNPTLTDFVNKFVEHYLDNVPTTGVACLQFDISSWKDATFKAQLALFDYPKKHK